MRTGPRSGRASWSRRTLPNKSPLFFAAPQARGYRRCEAFSSRTGSPSLLPLDSRVTRPIAASRDRFEDHAAIRNERPEEIQHATQDDGRDLAVLVRLLASRPRYTMATEMTPGQEQMVCAALVDLGWLENDHALHAEGIRVVCEVLDCTTNQAKLILHDLRSREKIDVVTSATEQPDERLPSSGARIRWVRPPS